MSADDVVQIGIDPRLELLAVIQLLSDDGKQFQRLTDFEFGYKQEVIDYFSPYRQHQAIALLAFMSTWGFGADAPPGLMVHLSPPPELALQYSLPEELLARAGGEESVAAFLEAIRAFARESKFAQFFEDHELFYQQVANGVQLDPAEIRRLERYYGMQQRSYHVVPVPLYRGGFGVRVVYPDGSQDVYTIYGPYGVQNDIPAFGSADQLAWHEFGHSFVNPLTAQNRNLIEAYSGAFEPIREQMSQYGYGFWEICVNEHIIRAVEIRLTYHKFGSIAGNRALENEMNMGFIYTADLVEKLEEYELNRDSYPTFADFYPELIKVFGHSLVE